MKAAALVVIAAVALWGTFVWFVSGRAWRKNRRRRDGEEGRPRWLRTDGRCITCGLPVFDPHLVSETINVTHCACEMRCTKCGKSHVRWSHHAPICTDPACRGTLMPRPQ